MMAQLVARGLATRFGDPANRRLVMVRITSKGVQFSTSGHQRTVRRMAKLLDTLGPDDRRELERLLRVVNDALDQGAASDPSRGRRVWNREPPQARG